MPAVQAALYTNCHAFALQTSLLLLLLLLLALLLLLPP
jgi:hypothetical protein